MRQVKRFLVDQRPMIQSFSKDDLSKVDTWFLNSNIMIGMLAKTLEQ
jgi:hypothetical protein